MKLWFLLDEWITFLLIDAVELIFGCLISTFISLVWWYFSNAICLKQCAHAHLYEQFSVPTHFAAPRRTENAINLLKWWSFGQFMSCFYELSSGFAKSLKLYSFEESISYFFLYRFLIIVAYRICLMSSYIVFVITIMMGLI